MTFNTVALTLVAIAALAPACTAQDSAAVSAPKGSHTLNAAPKVPTHAGTPSFQTRNPRYLVQAGDSFDLLFELSPEFNQTVVVQPDGFVTLKAVGDLHVAEHTIPELRDLVRQAYAKILRDPIISISLKDFEKPYFIASGQVGHPGKYELRGDTTVVEAVAMAGGFNTSAKDSQVVLYRRVSQDWMQGRILDVKKMMHDKNLSEDLHVMPGDMIIVPQNRISKIKPFIPNTGVYVNPIP
jgi:polysaccharide biosynthesis/export protein